jgi:hypothetical protein
MTFTRTGTSTFTEARVREVLKCVDDELVGCVLRGFISLAEKERWLNDLTYLLLQQAISEFEIQFIQPDGKEGAYHYQVSDDGSLLEASPSGGQRLHMLPSGTRASLHVDYRADAKPQVKEEMRKRGWGPGSRVKGTAVRDRAHSKDGYGFIRSKVGDW